MLDESRGPGTGVARIRWRRLALLAASSWTLMGCLVTEKVQFEVEPNYPPSIESTETASHPLNQVIVLNIEEGVPADLPLEVVVRDPNVRQPLFFKIFVDGLDNANEVHRGPIPVVQGAGGAAADAGAPPPTDAGQSDAGPNVQDELPGINRELETSIRTARLQVAGCHRIELRVTSDFAFNPPANPRIEGDLATAVWWVFTRRNTIDNPDPSSCPKDL